MSKKIMTAEKFARANYDNPNADYEAIAAVSEAYHEYIKKTEICDNCRHYRQTNKAADYSYGTCTLRPTITFAKYTCTSFEYFFKRNNEARKAKQ